MVVRFSLPDKPASENQHGFIIVALPATKAIVINEACKSKFDNSAL